MDEHTGIKGSAACSHHQPVDRRKAHCACNATSAFYCAETRAISEMGDNDAAIGNLRSDLFESSCDILVRDPMKPIAPDAFLRVFAWNSERLSYWRLVTMESGVKTGDLRQTRMGRENRPNWCEIMRLMQ